MVWFFAFAACLRAEHRQAFQGGNNEGVTNTGSWRAGAGCYG